MLLLYKSIDFLKRKCYNEKAMWSLKGLRAPRVSLRRIFMQLAATLVVAMFANTLLAPPAWAADAIWEGNTLTYEGNTLAPTTAPPDRAGEPLEFEYIDSASTPQKAYVVYFSDPQPSTARNATLVIYDYDPSAAPPYGSSSGPQAINVTRNLVGGPGDTTTVAGSTCDNSVTGGVGWIICPISNWIAGAIDGIYDALKTFLEVTPILDTNAKTNGPSGIYQLWDVVRTIANVCFVIAFLFIIYSTLTGIGISNYGIKEMIPRLIIAAILVNVSFWITALAVDISNLLGQNVNEIVMNIYRNSATGVDISWEAITSWVLAGGTISMIGFSAAAGTSFTSLGFILLAALISAAGAVLVAFIILAARQALITVLVAISPLAFVAYLLPNTRSLFSKWGKSFMTLLLFFPMFSLLFGGAQLAGAAIMENAGGRVHVVLIGLATQFVPLIITPLLVRFSSGILGQVANFANSSSRGLIDRARNWATDNADMWADRKRAKVARHVQDREKGERGALSWMQTHGMGRGAYWMDQNKRKREAYKKASGDMLQGRADYRWSQMLDEPNGPGRVRRRLGMESHQQAMARQNAMTHELHEKAGLHKENTDARNTQEWLNYLQSPAGSHYRAIRSRVHDTKGINDLMDKDMTATDELALKRRVNTPGALRDMAVRTGVLTKEAGAHQESIDATVDEAWTLRQENNRQLRQMRTTTHHTKGRAQIIEESMANADKNAFETLVNNGTGGYLQIRQRKTQAIADGKSADFQSSQVQADGDKQFYDTFFDSTPEARQLRKQFVATERAKKQSSTMQNILQKRADADWDRTSQNNQDIKSLRLQETEASDSQRLAEAQWNDLVEDVRLNGASSTHASSAADITAARNIQRSVGQTVAAERAAEAKKSIHQSRAQAEFIESAEGEQLNLKAQAAKDTLEGAQAKESALAQEWRTEEGAKNLTGEEAAIAQELQKAYIAKRAQTQRTSVAANSADQEYAKKVINDEYMDGSTETIAQVAGGMAGDAGVSQAKASAKQTVVEGVNKAIAAEKTLVSQVRENIILSDDIDGEKGLGHPDILDEPDERIAALAGAIAGKQHMQSHIKLWNRIGELGRQAGIELDAAKASGDPDAIAKAKAKVSKVKDMQQQVSSDKAKTPFGAGDQDLGAIAVGDYDASIYHTTRDRIETHLSLDKLAHMDPDDMRLIFEMAAEGKLSADDKAKIAQRYDEWQKDTNLSPLLAPKFTKFLDPIALEVNTGDRSGYATIPERQYTDIQTLLDDRS